MIWDDSCIGNSNYNSRLIDVRCHWILDLDSFSLFPNTPRNLCRETIAPQLDYELQVYVTLCHYRISNAVVNKILGISENISLKEMVDSVLFFDSLSIRPLHSPFAQGHSKTPSITRHSYHRKKMYFENIFESSGLECRSTLSLVVLCQ